MSHKLLEKQTDQNDIKDSSRDEWRHKFRDLKITFLPLKNSHINEEAKQPAVPLGSFMEGEISDETLIEWHVEYEYENGYNCGLPCGNQFDVISFPANKEGNDPATQIKRLVEQIPELKEAPVVRCGDGEYDLYVKILNQPENGIRKREITGSFNFTIKTKGDYVVAPGSVVCGNSYELISGDFESIPALELLQLLIVVTDMPEYDTPESTTPSDDSISTLNGFYRAKLLKQMGESVPAIERRKESNQKIEVKTPAEQDVQLIDSPAINSAPNGDKVSNLPTEEKPIKQSEKADEKIDAQNLEHERQETIDSLIQLIEKNRWSDTEVINTIFASIRDNIRYCQEISKFMYYDATTGIWIIDSPKAIVIKNLLRQEIQQILDRVEKMRSDAGRNPTEYQRYGAYMKTISRSLNGPKLKSLAECLAMNMSIHANLNDFDRNHEILCVKNGVLNLRTAEFFPHSPKYFHRNQAGVTYMSGERCPRFMQFLNEVFDADQEMIAYIQRVIGYAFTGLNDQKKFYFNYGLTNNGKSVFFNVVKNIAGDYAATVRETALSKANDHYGDKANPEIKKLQGKRIAVFSEYSVHTRLNSALLKDLTGGDKISMRYLHENGSEFESTAKLFFYSNHRPQFSENDAGIKDRLSLVQWNVVIPEEQRDRNLSEKLKNEYSGILNWILEGSRRYFAEGIRVPESVKYFADLDEKGDSDVLGAWISACVQLVDDSQMTTEELYRSYTQFSMDTPGNDANSKVLGIEGFGRKLSSLRLERCKLKSKVGGRIVENRGFKGIALN
jgi:P4 family phage/plasmid primase-like protien